MTNNESISTWNNPPKREEWETETYIEDGKSITLEEEPDLVFIILRASGEKRAYGQKKFVYEVQTRNGDYVGYCHTGGSGLPVKEGEAIFWIRKTYKKHVLEKQRQDLSPTI